MITNFKLFENTNEFKKGDYVLLDINALNNEQCKTDGLAMIINVEEKRTSFPYLVMFSDKQIFFLEKEKIIRYLTQKEIEDFKIKLAANKYNI